MRLEMGLAGHDVQFVSINKSDAESYQSKLTDRCKFQLLQDLPSIEVWELQDGGKDDMYIYGADGLLADYLPHAGDRPTNLSTDDGYNTVKNAILDVINAQ